MPWVPVPEFRVGRLARLDRLHHALEAGLFLLARRPLAAHPLVAEFVDIEVALVARRRIGGDRREGNARPRAGGGRQDVAGHHPVAVVADVCLAFRGRRRWRRIRHGIVRIDDAAAEDRVHDVGSEELPRLRGEDVARQHDHVRKLSLGDAALHLVLVLRDGGIERVGADGLLDRERLLRMPSAGGLSVQALARHRVVDVFHGVVGRQIRLVERSRQVGHDVHDDALLHHRAIRERPLLALRVEAAIHGGHAAHEVKRGHVGDEAQARGALDVLRSRVPVVDEAMATIARRIGLRRGLVPIDEEVRGLVADDVHADVEARLVGRDDAPRHLVFAREPERPVVGQSFDRERLEHHAAVAEGLQRPVANPGVAATHADAVLQRLLERRQREHRVHAHRQLAALLQVLEDPRVGVAALDVDRLDPLLGDVVDARDVCDRGNADAIELPLDAARADELLRLRDRRHQRLQDLAGSAEEHSGELARSRVLLVRAAVRVSRILRDARDREELRIGEPAPVVAA